MAAVAVVAGVAGPAAAQTVSLSSSYYTPLKISGVVVGDPSNDQQTSGGSGAPADLVGNSSSPYFLTSYDQYTNNLVFRVRLGTANLSTGQNPVPTFDRALFVYIFGDSGNSIDLVAGVDFSGSKANLGFWYPGTNANISPSTTSLSNPIQLYTVTNQNFNYNYVSAIDGVGTDIDADGAPDVYLTFAVPFADLQAQINNVNNPSRVPGVTTSTNLRYVAATATQDNSLNQDIGGVGATSSNSTTTYDNLGVISDPTSPISTAFTVPEPGSVALLAPLAVGALVPLARCRGRRKTGR